MPVHPQSAGDAVADIAAVAVVDDVAAGVAAVGMRRENALVGWPNDVLHSEEPQTSGRRVLSLVVEKAIAPVRKQGPLVSELAPTAAVNGRH